ncbi:hypothetical protein BDY19DRAFT_905390 [Irpex rosettiformis]|uniref:Uncharacterized protein n=1 Tax=Irpex rosettiformis TaxID=378272 RepID=A0ACB8U8E2_9APHY|nr:hypothetical protein BDY19DRAFT_905390 [Irpex rosettiformis]
MFAQRMKTRLEWLDRRRAAACRGETTSESSHADDPGQRLLLKRIRAFASVLSIVGGKEAQERLFGAPHRQFTWDCKVQWCLDVSTVSVRADPRQPQCDTRRCPTRSPKQSAHLAHTGSNNGEFGCKLARFREDYGHHGIEAMAGYYVAHQLQLLREAIARAGQLA